MRVSIDENGKVSAVVIAQSSGVPALDAAAVKTVRGWAYEPAFLGGQAVAGEVMECVTFAP